MHIPSVRELPLSTSVCYTYLLFSYRRETKDRHHSHYALHLEWFWIITTLSRLFATLYPRNTHLLKFSSITCTKIFFTLDSPFPIGITFQKCYLTPKDNRPLNMLENTSTFLDTSRSMRGPAIGAKWGESLIEVEFYCFDLIVVNPPVKPPSQKEQKNNLQKE